MFKLALLQRKFDAVLAMIKGSALCGQSIISYLQAKVCPDIQMCKPAIVSLVPSHTPGQGPVWAVHHLLA